MVISMGVCPFCGNGSNSACYAAYADGGFYCYSCGAHKSGGDRSWFPVESKSIETAYPFDVEFNSKKWPSIALSYLYKYYVNDALIRHYNIGYVPDQTALLYRLDDKHYQLRKLYNKGYISKGKKSNSLILHDLSDTVVIVEDFISAIRAAEFCNVLCMWGTKLTKEGFESIVGKYQNYVLWLDNDDAGLNAAMEIHGRIKNWLSKYRGWLDTATLTVAGLLDKRDLKEYTNNELEDLLNG